ncbi:alpha-xenorhabdolysin family binary toxin subunit B [Pseudomonas sp. 3A(2025)]
MTVHVLDTPLQLPKPDLAVVIARRTELNRSANTLSDFYLPLIRETLLSLIRELGEVDTQALRMISAVPGLVSSESLPDLLEALAVLQQDTESDQGEAIAQIMAEIDAQLQAASTGLAEHASALDNACVNFDDVSFGDLDAFITPINEEIVRLNNRITAIEAPLIKLREEETTLNKLIADLEAVSFFDKLKPLVETLKKLADIDPKDPLVGSIKAGIDAISSMLDLASNALKYEHLVNRRTRLQGQLDSIQDQARPLRSHLDEETARLARFALIQGMGTSKNEYVQELGKLHKALKQFIAYTFKDADSHELRVSRFIEYAAVLSTYMDELRRDWQS